MLAIEPISPDGKATWGTQQLTTITRIKQQESRANPYTRFSGVPRSRYGRSPRGIPSRPGGPSRPGSPYAPSSSAEVAQVYLAVELSEYELGETTPGMQIIKKVYEFRTVDNVEHPYYRMSGKGEIRFDRSKSLPEQIHYQMLLQVRSDDGTVSRVPVDVFCQRLTDAELAGINNNLSEAAKRSQERARMASVAPPVESLDQLLATLRDPQSNFLKKLTAFNTIKKMPPEEKSRKAVLDASEPYLKDSNSSLQNAAIAVFGVWGTEDRAGILIEMAGGFSQLHRTYAIGALGNIGGKNAAAAVAKRLTDSSDMYAAATALKKMGSVAEEPVLKLVDYPETRVREQAYQILGKVGGRKSEVVLKDKAKSDPNNLNRVRAQAALRDLQRRS